MIERRVPGSALELEIVARRARETEAAEQALKQAQRASNEMLLLFCLGKDIPAGGRLLEVTETEVVLEFPDAPAAASPPPAQDVRE